MEPKESNPILTKACIWYLVFDLFESHPLVADINEWFDPGSIENRQKWDKYTNVHSFLKYVAEYWDTHYQEAKVKNK